MSNQLPAPGRPTRPSAHLGSWYNAKLRDLPPANPQTTGAKAAIVPHAGYKYCGRVASAAFDSIAPGENLTFIVLAVLHCTTSSRANCLAPFSLFATPLGDLDSDPSVVQALLRSGRFELCDEKDDTNEHSAEMMLPLIARFAHTHHCRARVVVVYIQVFDQLAADALATVNADHIRFIASSDMTHYGLRFSFSPRPVSPKPLSAHVRHLDSQLLHYMERGNVRALQELPHSVCGMAAITTLIVAMRQICPYRLVWLDYDVSNDLRDTNDSSVSYAAGAFVCQ